MSQTNKIWPWQVQHRCWRNNHQSTYQYRCTTPCTTHFPGEWYPNKWFQCDATLMILSQDGLQGERQGDVKWKVASCIIITWSSLFDISNRHLIGHLWEKESFVSSRILLIFCVLHINGLVQQRRNCSALAMELWLSCTKPSIWYPII